MSKKWKRRMGALIPLAWGCISVGMTMLGFEMPTGMYIVGLLIAISAGVALGL